MSAEIKTLRENVSELKSQINNTDKKLDRIIFILDNDEGTGQEGLVAQVHGIKKKNHTDITRIERKIDDFIAEYKKAEAVKNAKAGVIGAIAGTLVSIGAFLIKTFYHS